MQQCFAKRGFFICVLGCVQSGVPLHLIEKVVDGAIRGVVEWRGESMYGEGKDFFMHRVAGKLGPFPVIEAHDRVGMPSAAPFDPFAIEEIMAQDCIDAAGVERQR